jgi:sulfhydrogenase subunit beta (sulfur reductase)
MTPQATSGRSAPAILPKSALQNLVEELQRAGHTVIAPVLNEQVIQLRPIQNVHQIAHGLNDEQDGGRYRLVPGEPELFFKYVVGPDSGKRFFFPPHQDLFSLRVEDDAFMLTKAPPQAPKLALLGLRPCDLAAIKLQDRVFGITREQETYRCESETYYREVREQSFLIAINCTHPSGTCFCVSMGTGPQAREGFDLAMTELREGFVVHIGSQRGQMLASKLPLHPPSPAELELEELKLQQATEHMGRRLETEGMLPLLRNNVRHPHWEDVARRCLGCGNCTMVCPTCFCSTVTDTNDIASGEVTRTRQWDSCFTHQFSYTTGGTVRNTIRGRYRHWLLHKLCTWQEQFEAYGCVGCGRCITWCPVGIDLTAEVETLRQGNVISVEAAGRFLESEVRSW